MARKTQAAPQLSPEEVKTRLHLDPRPWCQQRWLIIYNALDDPREASEIAKHLAQRSRWFIGSLPVIIAWEWVPSRPQAKEVAAGSR